jgi:hypothetical protein
LQVCEFSLIEEVSEFPFQLDARIWPALSELGLDFVVEIPFHIFVDAQIQSHAIGLTAHTDHPASNCGNQVLMV